ncbi:hypothetical protein BDZ91DRAFT_476503 [Kalaharituber pfeilii]|nr:hypothetical protein BDZ91DRAFT_476503 [Kalaharituber pfeilii]
MIFKTDNQQWEHSEPLNSYPSNPLSNTTEIGEHFGICGTLKLEAYCDLIQKVRSKVTLDLQISLASVVLIDVCNQTLAGLEPYLTLTKSRSSNPPYSKYVVAKYCVINICHIQISNCRSQLITISPNTLKSAAKKISHRNWLILVEMFLF